MSAARRVLSARTALVLDAPFFGALALRLELVEDPSCDTAWTDGRSIGYSPAFVDSLQDPELVALLAHEVMHVAAGHPWRRGAREARRWNMACDYAINEQLQESGFQLPSGALLDANYRGMPSEWIYDRIPEQSGGEEEEGAPQPGEVRDAPSETDQSGTPAPTEADWQQAVQQAAQLAAARGELPGAAERFAKAVTEARVDWRSVLLRFVQERSRDDYSWTRPSSRHLPRGLYLPALRSEQLGEIAVAIDTSGSVDDTLLRQFAAELDAIRSELQPRAVRVLYCDYSVRKQERYDPGEPLQLAAHGGGGTDFRPVFAELEEDPPALLVYLTDLDGPYPAAAPEYPVLWGCTSRNVASWGETVRMF